MANLLEKRILQYCKTVGIEFKNGPRFSSWRKYGLPDMRGFTPQLRAVNLYKDEELDEKALLKGASSAIHFDKSLISSYWLLHDALHIMFYDFAFAHLKEEAWADDDRFLENHLASELFAVTVLDYHHLVHTQMAGLAVDLNSASWPSFQKFLNLPDIKSFEFFKHLFQCYFGANDSLLSFSNLRKLTSTSASKNAQIQQKLAQWLGHELRYGEKQRSYAYLWLQDLKCVEKKDKSVLIQDSEVIYPIWDLVQTLTLSDDQEWGSFLDFMKKSVSKQDNYFSHFKKSNFKTTSANFKNLDFRFTDITALDKDALLEYLEGKIKPSSSHTFLFWQILSLTQPEVHNKKELNQIQEFSELVQKPKAKVSNWNEIQKICTHAVEKQNWLPDPIRIASFFLP